MGVTMTDSTTHEPGLGRGGRMSRPRKREAVLRLLRGEGLELVSCVPVHSFETPLCAYAAIGIGPI